MTTEKNTPQVPAAAAAPETNAIPAQDDFEAVFAEITKDGADDAKPADPAAAAKPAPAADAGKGNEADAAVAAAEVAAAGAGEAGAGAAAPGAAAEPTDAEKLAAAQARVAELEAAAAKPAEEVKKPEAAAPAAEAAKDTPIEWYKPSDEEKAVLDAYAKEWPEANVAMGVLLRQAVYNAVQYTYSQVAKAYGPRLDKIDGAMSEVESFMALSELRTAHNDYDTIHDKVVQWVDTLPGYIKKAAHATLESGTPEEVSELIGEFKKANPAVAVPAVAAKAGAAAPAAPVPGKTELSAAAKKAARTLSVVDSKRTSETAAAVDPTDFDGAWREATAS